MAARVTRAEVGRRYRRHSVSSNEPTRVSAQMMEYVIVEDVEEIEVNLQCYHRQALPESYSSITTSSQT
jgi:hypothetical protein